MSLIMVSRDSALPCIARVYRPCSDVSGVSLSRSSIPRTPGGTEQKSLRRASQPCIKRRNQLPGDRTRRDKVRVQIFQLLRPGKKAGARSSLSMAEEEASKKLLVDFSNRGLRLLGTFVNQADPT